MSFNTKLTNLLKTNPNFIDDEGELLLAAVQDSAWKIDHVLIKLLLSDEEVKSKFFDEIDGYWVFNINTFLDYISQKNFLDNSYTRFRNKVGLTIGGKYLSERGEIALTWAYKDCVLEGGQTKEEEKRKEVFFNEILAQDEINRLLDPKVLTNFKRYTTAGEQPVTDFKRDENGVIRENLIIKGNNLLALHSLKSHFRGKVKLIYIDPPYNTGNDTFGYNDNFNHATWLTFMKSRLEIARGLLAQSGVLFCSINHVELGYLLILLDEVFGKENKLSIITLKAGTTASYRSINDCPVNVTEFVVAYRKSSDFSPKQVYRASSYSEDYSHFIDNFDDDAENWIIKPITDYVYENENVRDWSEFKKKYGVNWRKIRFDIMERFAIENKTRVISLNTLQKPAKKTQDIIDLSRKDRNKVHVVHRENLDPVYCYNGRTLAFFDSKFRNIDGVWLPSEILTNIWDDVSFLGIGPEGGVSLPNGKKPEFLIKTILDLTTEQGDLVLDFNSGSGTTCAVAHKMNRQYIGIEQLDYGENDSVCRINKVLNGDNSGISQSVKWRGGGNFIYCELMQYNEVFIDRIEKAYTSDELLKIWQDMSETSFLNWYVNPERPEEAIKDFIAIGKQENGLVKQKKLLVELLDKNQLYVNLSEIDDAKFNVSEEDKALNKAFYGEI